VLQPSRCAAAPDTDPVWCELNIERYKIPAWTTGNICSKRKILTLRIIGAIIVIPVGHQSSKGFKTAYQHHSGSIRNVILALLFGVAFLIHRRISRIKAELTSLGLIPYSRSWRSAPHLHSFTASDTSTHYSSSMLVSDFNFDLPQELIAQHPPALRGSSRMLVLNRATGVLTDGLFASLPQLLQPGDLLILNDSRVLPARLFATRSGARHASPLAPALRPHRSPAHRAD